MILIMGLELWESGSIFELLWLMFLPASDLACSVHRGAHLFDNNKKEAWISSQKWGSQSGRL